jgi:quercetin dioxygenase-like cupin family protein
MRAQEADAIANFKIFRGCHATPLVIAETTGLSDVALAGMKKLEEAGGLDNGHDSRVVFEAPGFSLTYLWFKSGFHLPRHSHSVDCAYYVVGGSLQLGNDILGKGDGFFVPADVPYSYVAGPKGVEVLEFRHHPCRDIRLMADNPAFWDKVTATAAIDRARWNNELRPSTTLAEAGE